MRALALYLRSLKDESVESERVGACLRSVEAHAGAKGVSLEWTVSLSGGPSSTTVRGAVAGPPYGAAFAAAAGESALMVRCFLDGGLVPAAECAFLVSGRLYHRDALDYWLSTGDHSKCDPETGEILPLSGKIIPWTHWMGSVPFHVVRAAVRTLAARPSIDPTAPARDRIVEDRVRYAVAVATDAIVCHSTSDLLVPIVTQHRERIDVAGGDGDGDATPLVRGFDGLCMRHVELRHPEWEPRGPWRLGTPSPLPDDDTIDDHERAGAGPVEHLESHGIVHVALRSPSFMGADLRGVWFFGHRFVHASFVGARLDRCAFIGCHFDGRVVFADAVLADCVFRLCRSEGVLMDSDAINARIVSHGAI